MMNKPRFVLWCAWLCLTVATFAQTSSTPIDITSRKVTDPLLKIESQRAMFDDGDPFFLVAKGAVADRSRTPPVFNSLWGKNGVILMEPFSLTRPAKIDFSELTSTTAGRLLVEVHRHPSGDAELQLVKAGKVIKSRKLGSSTWEYLSVGFNKEPVQLILKANGWSYEFGFVNYIIRRPEGGDSFLKEPDSRSQNPSPDPKGSN